MPGDRAGQQQDHPPIDPRTIAVANRERPDGNARPTRRMPWPRASGPSSRITGTEPACMASACGCGPAPGVRSCPAGAVRAAARYLPDRNVRFSAVLPARNRMRRSTEFDATVRYGVHAVQSDVIVHIRGGNDGDERDGPRVGLIIGRAVGSAVDRHRVARRLRHVARTILGDLQQSDQVVIRALPSSRQVSSARLEQQLRSVLRRSCEPAGTDR
jgi:ribonuclease P protein component